MGFSPEELDSNDPVDILGKNTWANEPESIHVGHNPASYVSDREVDLPKSLVLSLVKYLGPYNLWTVLVDSSIFNNGNSGSKVVWLKGITERTIVMRFVLNQWLIISGPKGLKNLNEILAVLPKDSVSEVDGVQVHLPELVELYAQRGIVAILPGFANQYLASTSDNNKRAIADWLHELESTFTAKKENQKLNISVVVLVRNRKTTLLEKWNITGTITSDLKYNIQSISISRVPEEFPLTWTRLDSGL
jgi:hypothetical protein